MKKSMILATVVMMAAMMFTGCSDSNEVFTPQSYIAEETTAGVVIDVRDREIEVALSTDNQIHVDYFESEKEFYDFSVSEDQVLTMAAASNKEWKDYVGSKSDADVRKILLLVPDALLSNVTLKTTNGDIVLSELTVTGDMTISANGGNITFDKVDVGNALNLNVKNGNINGTVVGGYDDFHITCDIKKGESNLPSEKEGGDKKLQVSANNGDVTVDFYKR